MEEIEEDRLRDFRDVSACFSFLGGGTRCKGGRIVVDGYVCPHCGSYEPKTYCSAPKHSN